MSELGATILTAIATLALAVFALITAILAFMAWRKQSREVSDQAEMLELQAKELKEVSAEREREARDRRRAQAAMVYMWQGPVHTETSGALTPDTAIDVYVRNTSQQPIYDLRVEWLIVTRDGDIINEETYHGDAPLMPSALLPARAPVDPGLLSDEPMQDVSAFVTFRDRAGVWWRTGPTGNLEDLSGQPVPSSPSEPGAPDNETGPDVGEHAP